MTIQDVIDNDLTTDIRTGTAADDSVEMIDFPGSVLPNFEYSNCNRCVSIFISLRYRINLQINLMDKWTKIN